MMEKKVAIEIQQHALDAIRSLAQALSASENRCSSEEFQQIKRGVGLSMGRIETELLGVIYAVYPELDDLKDI
jgi:hypothetical protein